MLSMVLCLALLGPGDASMAQATNEVLLSLLPAEAQGYRPAGKPEFFDADSLFQLINGGAEVYRALGVQRVVSQRFGRQGSPDILTDIFDMGDSTGAWAAYHHDIREAGKAQVGQESEMQGGSLAFWKDRYFVSLVATGQADSNQAVLAAMAKLVAGKIPKDGALPSLLALLPKEERIDSQLFYFRDWTSLNLRYFLAHENLLYLDGQAEGMLARYRPEGLVLLVAYPTKDKARLAHEAITKALLPELKAGAKAVRLEDGSFASCGQVGRFWLGVFETKSEAPGLALYRRAQSLIQAKIKPSQGAGHE